MASYGKVFDLFNNRNLELQDVIGNVEPLPSLVPYEEYEQSVIVYRMDTDHEVFMALIQDFTERKARATGKELWTWYVQWDVDETAPSPPVALPSSPKKPRLSLGQPKSPNNAQNGPRMTAQRRIIAADLMREEDMLRILLDVVQVESTIVPNFIEFLYRWVDFYEGDGKALKAALRGEIPSLWDFEYHPLVLPQDAKEAAEKARADESDDDESDDSDEAGSKTPKRSGAEDLAQGSPTKKMREKPDLAAIEEQAEESERLQYREVHYGIQPRKLNEGLPPLINIPQDKQKRDKYYAACFKSRQRAYYLLLDAGVTVAQMKNYKRTQDAHPRDTPEHAGGQGLKHYEHDAQLAQPIFRERERQMKLRNKQTEIDISNKLAMEAQLAARSATPEGPSGVPLIPLTPSYTSRPSMSRELLRRIREARASTPVDRINIVPTPLVGKMRSKLFEGAKDRQALLKMFPRGGARPGPRHTANTNDNGSQDTDVDSDSESDSDDSDDSGDDVTDQPQMASTASRPSTVNGLPPLPSLPRPSLPPPLQPSDSTTQPPPTFVPNLGSFVQQQPTPGHTSVPITGAAPTAIATPDVVEYMRNLNPDQARNLVPMLNQNIRQAIARSIAAPNAGLNVQAHLTNNSQPSAVHMPPTAANAFIFRQPPRTSLPSIVPPQAPAITVSPPQPSPGQSHHQTPRGFEGQTASFGRSIPHGFPALPLPTSSGPGQAVQQGDPRRPGGMNTSGPYGSGLETGVAGFGFAPPLPSQIQYSFQQQHVSNRLNLHQQPQQPAYAVAPGLSAPPVPPAFAQRLLAAQRGQTTGQQGHQNAGGITSTPSLQNTAPFPPKSPPVQQPNRLPPPPSPNPFLSTPGPSMQRNAPSPLKLAPPPPSPFSSLAPSIMATSPFASSHRGIPIQIYYPNILRPSNLIGPGGLKLGNIKDAGDTAAETDAFLLGYSQAGSGNIVISRGIFLPAGVWTNALERVRKDKYEVLETYYGPRAPIAIWSDPRKRVPHKAAYSKISQAFALISPRKREEELTKRWRVTPGPMTATDRGAVWEGWAVTLDKGIEMGVKEREGALVLSPLIIEGETEVDVEKERRRKEIEELLDREDSYGGDEEEEEERKESEWGSDGDTDMED
jgi:hypothetical protein